MTPQKKLNSVLLIDDDDITLFYNTHILTKLGLAEHIHSEMNGIEALKYLNQKEKHAADYVKPDLILLDINMPIMNGFEFLAEYEKLPSRAKEMQQIVVVSSSTLEVDMTRAAKFPSVSAYCPKPIGGEAIAEIIGRLFPAASHN